MQTHFQNVISGENIYTDYFNLIPRGLWSLESFVTYAICNNIYVDKIKAHREFYGNLNNIGNCEKTSQEACERARELIQRKKVSSFFYVR